MKDLSVNSASNANNINTSSKNGSRYEQLHKEYEVFRKKSSQSDFANSPVVLEKELTILSGLKEAASREGRSEEVEKIEARELEIYKMVSIKKPLSDVDFHLYIMPKKTERASFVKKTDAQKEKEFNAQAYINQFSEANPNMKLTEEVNNILVQLGKNNYDISHAASVLIRCFDCDGNIRADKTEAIEMFLEAKMAQFILPQLLEDLDSQDQKMNLNACKNVCEFKKMGLDDVECLKTAVMLSKYSFEDEDLIKFEIGIMKNENISVGTILRLIDILKTKNTENDKYTLDKDAVQSLCRLKKAMFLTRENETLERRSAINNLGVQRFTFGDKSIVLRDGKAIYISPDKESVYDLQQKYEETLSIIEEEVLCEFADKYKNDDGTIDSKYVRIFAALRHQGITYSELNKFVDRCVDDNGEINKQELKNIGKIKIAGGLTADVELLLDACQRDADGNCDERDINNIVTLTECVIGGTQITELLPDIRKSPELMDYITYFTEIFDDRKCLNELISLVKDKSGNIDENAISLVNNLILTYQEIPEFKEFKSMAETLISAAKNKDEDFVSDDAAGVVSVMLSKGKTPEYIIKILDLCRDDNDKIDENLSQIVWDFTLQDADISSLSVVLNSLKMNNKAINHTMAQQVISLLEAGEKYNNIIKYLFD